MLAKLACEKYMGQQRESYAIGIRESIFEYTSVNSR